MIATAKKLPNVGLNRICPSIYKVTVELIKNTIEYASNANEISLTARGLEFNSGTVFIFVSITKL